MMMGMIVMMGMMMGMMMMMMMMNQQACMSENRVNTNTTIPINRTNRSENDTVPLLSLAIDSERSQIDV